MRPVAKCGACGSTRTGSLIEATRASRLSPLPPHHGIERLCAKGFDVSGRMGSGGVSE